MLSSTKFPLFAPELYKEQRHISTISIPPSQHISSDIVTGGY